jgi:hypothetical protein
MRVRTDTYHVTWDKFTSEDLPLGTVTNNKSTHSDISLQAGNHIGGLLFLIPADGSIKAENTDDHTEVNPVLQTSSQKNSQLHD